jgi:hypothetical protein
MMAALLFDTGWHEDTNARTQKYRVFWKEDRKFKYFLGPNGAMRKGRTVSESWSCGSRDRKKVEEAYAELAAKNHTGNQSPYPKEVNDEHNA